jgi:hypothetical protein
MRGLSDTSPEAQRVFEEAQRALPLWRKWEVLGDLYRLGRRLHAAGVLSRSPDATPAQVRDDWMARNLGAALAAPVPRGDPGTSTPAESSPAVEFVAQVLDELGIAYALSGSLASSLYGVTRNTIDADVCAEPFVGKESEFVARFGHDYYVSLDAVRAAVRDRSGFNIIQTTTGFKVDIFVRKDRPFERGLLQRRRRLVLPGSPGRSIDVVAPEDIVLQKLEWYRLGNEASERQWSDILGVLRIQAGQLDPDYLDRWAGSLGVRDLLERARAEAS